MINFKLNELLIIAIISATGLAIKPVVSPLIHLISTPLMIPGGSLAGGIYMSWLVLAKLIIPKRCSALLVGLTQAFVVLILGFFGNHGIFSIISYGLPGLMIEGFCFLYQKTNLISAILNCIVANCTGALLIALMIFRMPLIPLLISVSIATVSAIIGGFLAWVIYVELTKLKVIKV